MQDHISSIYENSDRLNQTQSEDEKMIEDDIDRMVAQMQNRHYDSSRYT
jgi:hypothetical protein